MDGFQIVKARLSCSFYTFNEMYRSRSYNSNSEAVAVKGLSHYLLLYRLSLVDGWGRWYHLLSKF